MVFYIINTKWLCMQSDARAVENPISAIFDLSGLESAAVEYWRWYTNNLGYSPGEDWWTVEVSDDAGAKV